MEELDGKLDVLYSFRIQMGLSHFQWCVINYLSFMCTFRNNMGSVIEIKCLEGYILLICAEIFLNTEVIYHFFY